MLQFVAVEGMTLTITTPGVAGLITINSPCSTRVKAGGHGVYCGSLQLSVSSVTSASCGSEEPGSVTSATIVPSATGSRAENQFVLRQGDKVTGLSTTGATNPGSPSESCTIVFDIEITSAGQSKVRAQ